MIIVTLNKLGISYKSGSFASILKKNKIPSGCRCLLFLPKSSEIWNYIGEIVPILIKAQYLKIYKKPITVLSAWIYKFMLHEY